MSREVSFGIIPLRENGGWEVLLIHQRSGDFWGFPKGHPEPGEEGKEAAERELFEEVGLGVDTFFSLAPLTIEYTFQKGEVRVEKRVEFYPARVCNEVAIDEAEVIEAKWVSLQELPALISYTEGKALAKQLQEILS